MRELCPDLPAAPVSRWQVDDDCKTTTLSWYALTVRHQHERQTEQSLNYKGWETLVPVYRRRARWSDRTKEVECPLFSGYVLCHFTLEERIRVLDTPGVARIVGFGGVPAAIEEREIEEIQRVIASQLAVQPWPYVKVGDRVRVERGPSMPTRACL
jgi:transcriptional antiterminator NusG